MFFDLLERLFSTDNWLWYVIPLLLYFALLYNSMVSIRHNVTQAISNIDVLLKQRHDEIPKLVATCKQYMQHERQTLDEVIAARNRVAKASQDADMEALGKAESSLRSRLGSIFALSESYPELKADGQFRQLQVRISELEGAIADRRELYNEAVTINNARIEQFPDFIVARLMRFMPFKTLVFNQEELADHDINELFSR